MSVVNMTPDSFSGDGLLVGGPPTALAELFRSKIALGADLFDIGGESTRPGHTPVTVETEIGRIAEPISIAAGLDEPIPISVDTSRSAVAEVAVAKGATIVNDVTGFRRDPSIAAFVADTDAMLVITHSSANAARETQRDDIGGGYTGAEYTGNEFDNVVDQVQAELSALIDFAQKSGVSDDQIIIDPGIGLGKNTEQNLTMTANLDRFTAMGFPLLYGPSRKRFIGDVLDTGPYDRLEGTAAVVALGVRAGADLMRVHDVAAMRKVIDMINAVVAAN